MTKKSCPIIMIYSYIDYKWEKFSRYRCVHKGYFSMNRTRIRVFNINLDRFFRRLDPDPVYPRKPNPDPGIIHPNPQPWIRISNTLNGTDRIRSGASPEGRRVYAVHVTTLGHSRVGSDYPRIFIFFSHWDIKMFFIINRLTYFI